MACADLNAQELRPFAAPNPGHIRHTRLFQVLPGHRRERSRCPGRPFVRSPGTRASETPMKDWIVPIGDAFDSNGMLRRFTSRVVAWVLAERTLRFESLRISRNKTFKDNLRGGRHQQIVGLAFDQLHWRSSKRSRQLIFRMIDRRRRRYEQGLVPTDDHGNGHFLAAIFVLAEVLAPSLRHGEQDANSIFLADHAAVGPRRSEEHTSELQSLRHLVCRLLLEKKK